MEKQAALNQSEWIIMERLWQRPYTLMELVGELRAAVGWSKSTVATLVRRMEEKGIICYSEQGRTKIFRPAVSREAVAARETESLLKRAYHGSIGLMVSAMAQGNHLTKEDIAELYEILQRAEDNAK